MSFHPCPTYFFLILNSLVFVAHTTSSIVPIFGAPYFAYPPCEGGVLVRALERNVGALKVASEVVQNRRAGGEVSPPDTPKSHVFSAARHQPLENAHTVRENKHVQILYIYIYVCVRKMHVKNSTTKGKRHLTTLEKKAWTACCMKKKKTRKKKLNHNETHVWRKKKNVQKKRITVHIALSQKGIFTNYNMLLFV